MKTQDVNEIRKIAPRRYPFLLVNRIAGIENVAVNEPFFQGHFPDFHARFRNPVVLSDTLRLEMAMVERRSNVAKMAGRATVDSVLVAEVEAMCKLVPAPGVAAGG